MNHGKTHALGGDALDLEALPGLGPSLRARLVTALGSEAAVVDALQRGDVDVLSAVKGISRDRAVQLVLSFRGEGESEWLRTPRSKEIHQDILERLKTRAHTTWAHNRLDLLVPSTDTERVKARAEAIARWHKKLAKLDLDALHAALKGLAALKQAKPRPAMGVVLLVEGEDDLEVLEAAGMTRWVEVALPDEPALEASLVVYASRRGLIDTGPEVVEVPFTTPEDLVPWATIAFFQANQKTLAAGAALAEVLGNESACAQALDALGGYAEAEVTFEDVEAAATEAAEAANAHVRSKAAELTMTGTEVLEALSGRARKLDQLVAEAHGVARKALRDKVGLDLPLFSDAFPIELDPEGLQAARARFEAQEAAERYHTARKVASDLERLRDAVEQEIEAAHEVDYFLAIERFRRDHHAHPARFGSPFAVQGAIHLDLAGGGTPVDYDLSAGVCLLTGANSGGKTTLLETLAQIAMLAHMGLPVPARDAVVPELDGVYFFTRPRGLDAGAFETFLTAFEPVALDPDRCLVLADELEAMTELEAAGAILGVLVNRLVTRGSPAVVVTHMADSILAHADVRVDGIEAKGLDENNELIVDRTPKTGHRARSTPELVLQRLRNTRSGEARTLYDQMLETLRSKHGK